MSDPFDTRRSYVAVPSPVQPDKPQNTDAIQPQGSEHNLDVKETSLLKNN